MYDISWFKAENFADDLQSSSQTEHGKDRADADRSAEQPADQQYNSDHSGLYDTDRRAGKAFTEGDQQGISGTAAQSCFHIKIYAIAHNE